MRWCGFDYFGFYVVVALVFRGFLGVLGFALGCLVFEFVCLDLYGLGCRWWFLLCRVCLRVGWFDRGWVVSFRFGFMVYLCCCSFVGSAWVAFVV